MRIIYRYILKEAFTYFAITLFAFTAILLTLRMLRFASLIVDRGVELLQVATVFLAIVPTFLEIAIPLATLLGIMLAFARFSGDSEVVVLRASGVSLYRLIVPVFVFGLIAAAIGLYVSHDLKPWGYRTLNQTLFDIARTKSTSGLEAGIFNRMGNLTIYTEEVDYQTGALRRVLIDDRRDADMRKVVFAQAGFIVSDSEHRTITIELHDGTIHEMVKGKYVLTRFASNNLALSPDQLFSGSDDNNSKQTSELSLDELRERVRYYTQLLPLVPAEGELQKEDFLQPTPTGVAPEKLTRDQLKRKIRRVQLEMGQRFSLPLAALALAILALPLGIQPARAQRTWGVGLSASLGLLVFVFYYGLFSIGVVLAQGGRVHPLVALWIPNVAVIFLAALLNYKTASEQWQSVAHALEQFVMRVLSRFRSQGQGGIA